MFSTDGTQVITLLPHVLALNGTNSSGGTVLIETSFAVGQMVKQMIALLWRHAGAYGDFILTFYPMKISKDTLI